MNKGQNLYKKAKKIIPGGNQFLSKRPEMFLPDQWPAYYKKAKGCKIWDLDNNQFIDMSLMGVGSCSLGYSNYKVNLAVTKSLKNGSLSTLNSFEEVELAEKLIALHPYMEMIRFAKTGGEANAIAIRIARSITKKSKVAVCGYHGWHDWYLSTNLSSKNNLDSLLLPGLEVSGVPKELTNTSLPFSYGKINELKKHVDLYENEIGAICLEVQRGHKIDLNFIKNVIKIGKKINAVIIFDEISSGFRLSTGGLYKNYDLEPDMVLLGKALGNGYPINELIISRVTFFGGKKEIMNGAQDSFISSGYWSERTGFAAALETIRIFEEENVVDDLILTSNYFRKLFIKLFKELNLNIEVEGLHTIPFLKINEAKPLEIKTLFTQEMLKKGYLASNLTFLSVSHTESVINKYADECFEVFRKIKESLINENLKNYIDGAICHSGFKRLT